MTSPSDAQIRDMAVAEVDRRHGYTMEFAPSPEQHRDEYDREEDVMRASWGLEVLGR